MESISKIVSKVLAAGVVAASVSGEPADASTGTSAIDKAPVAAELSYEREIQEVVRVINEVYATTPVACAHKEAATSAQERDEATAALSVHAINIDTFVSKYPSLRVALRDSVSDPIAFGNIVQDMREVIISGKKLIELRKKYPQLACEVMQNTHMR